MNSKIYIFILTLFIMYACSSVEETQEIIDQRAKNYAKHMSIEEIKYNYFVNTSPSIILKREKELRYADYILADELSARGVKAEEIQSLKNFANASLLASHLLQKGNILQGHKFAQEVIKESGVNFEISQRIYQCWINNLDGYQPKSYTVYEKKDSWNFESFRTRYSTFYRLRLFVENIGQQSIYRGKSDDFRFIGRCSNGYERPPNCRIKPSRGVTKPNYCKPA